MVTPQHRFLDVRLLEAIDGIPAGTVGVPWQCVGGGEEWLIDADRRDLLLVRIPGRGALPD